MAIEKQINVVISAVDQYSGGLNAFGLGIGGIAKAAGAAAAAILGLSAAAAKIAYDLGSSAFQSAVDFHDAMYDVTAVAQSFGTTGDDVSAILDTMAMKFPVTGKAAGETLQIIAQLGYGAKDQLIAVSDAANTLSLATGTDMKTAAEATLATMNAFGMEVDQAGRVMNTFAAVAFTSAANVYDLREAMKFAGPAAALAGISFEETAGTLGLLKNLGLEASQAGTTFRMAMAKLLDVTPKAEAALAKYGLTAEDINPKVNSLSDIIGKFSGKTIEADDAVDIFGVRAASMSLVINKGQQAFDDYVKSITGTTAAVDAMSQKMQEWTNVAAQVEGDMDRLKALIGVDLLKAVTQFVGTDENSGLRSIINQFGMLEQLHGDVGDPLVETFQALVAIGQDIFKKMFGDVEGLYKWIALISEALGKNVEVIGIWIGAFAEAFIGSTDDADTLRSMLQAVNVTIGLIAAPIALVHDMFVDLWEMIKKGIETVDFAWASWNAGILIGLKKIYEAMDALPFVDLKDTIAGLETDIAGWEDKMANAFSPVQLGTWTSTVTDAFGKATVAISEMGDEADLMRGKTKDATDTGVQGATNWTKALTEMGDGFEIVDGKMVAVKQEAVDWGKEMAGSEIIVNKLADQTGELEVAQKGVTEEAAKTNETLSELEKHELKLELEQFQHDLEMAEIELKAKFSMLEKEMELKAKVDIAELKLAEEQAKTTQHAFDAIAKSVGDVSSAIASMTGQFADAKDLSTKWQIEDWIEQQLSLQEALINAQIELTKAEAEKTAQMAEQQKIQNEQLKSGQMNPIQVDVIGVTEPWLKGLMQSLFDEIMVKAQAEAFSCMCE